MQQIDEQLYGLAKADLELITQLIKKNKKVSRIVLFGSRAKNTHLKGSDVDIAISGDDLSLDDLNQLLVDLNESRLPYKVDLVNYDTIKNVNLVEHIKRVGIVLYG